ncbi:MAG TPA: VacJ family lipoprotein [Rhizomicrobium sp.]|jgi:phospholipid-binding lipoprotein MlaA|nr:VacJ family lipoprotein [Rhizomicrobium sp.]
MKTSIPAIAALAAALALGACSSPSAESLAQNDPWEATNRDIFDFSMAVDRAVARPVAKGYRAAVPEFARDGIHNALTNLRSPVILANDVLQGEADKAGDTLGRIVINSTVGLGGLIDVASKIGIPGHDNDFGVTLGKDGVHEGSYLVLPFVGPRPPRDLLGSVVDVAFDPLTYAQFHGDDTWMAIRFGVGVLDGRTAQLDAVETIERSSIDFYATTRNLYRQSRNALINAGTDRADEDLPNL